MGQVLLHPMQVRFTSLHSYVSLVVALTMILRGKERESASKYKEGDRVVISLPQDRGETKWPRVCYIEAIELVGLRPHGSEGSSSLSEDSSSTGTRYLVIVALRPLRT